jgi:hypothetical protein
MPDLHFGKTEMFLSKWLDKRTEYGIANGARRANQARGRNQEYERKRSRARRERAIQHGRRMSASVRNSDSSRIPRDVRKVHEADLPRYPRFGR